jgi:hypothetical protein
LKFQFFQSGVHFQCVGNADCSFISNLIVYQMNPTEMYPIVATLSTWCSLPMLRRYMLLLHYEFDCLANEYKRYVLCRSNVVNVGWFDMSFFTNSTKSPRISYFGHAVPNSNSFCVDLVTPFFGSLVPVCSPPKLKSKPPTLSHLFLPPNSTVDGNGKSKPLDGLNKVFFIGSKMDLVRKPLLPSIKLSRNVKSPEELAVSLWFFFWGRG